jgi:hypothetical protein
MLYLAFAGLAFGFIMASRPDLFICLIFVVPLIPQNAPRRKMKKSPIACLISFRWQRCSSSALSRLAGITNPALALSSTSVLPINTPWGMSNLHVQANQIFPAIFHYFFNPWGFTSTGLFPYLARHRSPNHRRQRGLQQLFQLGDGRLCHSAFLGDFLDSVLVQKGRGSLRQSDDDSLPGCDDCLGGSDLCFSRYLPTLYVRALQLGYVDFAFGDCQVPRQTNP